MPRTQHFNKTLYNNWKNVALFSSFLIMLVATTLSNSYVSATSSSASTVSVTLESLITLRILDSSATSEINSLAIDLTPTPNGVFSKNTMMVEVSTPNATGYKLYLTSVGTNPVNSSTGTYTTDLVNTDASITDVVATLPSSTNVTEADFRVKNSAYKNKWGYSLNGYTISQAEDANSPSGVTNTITEITDTSSITYANIPAHGSNIEIDSKDAPTTQSLTPITIGVNASSAIASGTYQNTLEYTAIANPIPKDFTLNFDQNAEDAVTDLPDAITASSVGSSYTFTIPSTLPTRTGHALKEYNTKADGTGDTYQPGEDFELVIDDADPGSTSRTLYAIWKLESYTINIAAPSGGSVSTDSLEVAYGNSNTFTVMAKQGYYITGISCPNGYACSGYDFTPDSQYSDTYVQPQTITVSNSNTTAGGDITFEQTLATWTDTNNKIWTYAMENTTYANASSLCPSGYHIPTGTELQTLIGAPSNNPGELGTNYTNMSLVVRYTGGTTCSSTVDPLIGMECTGYNGSFELPLVITYLPTVLFQAVAVACTK